MTLISQWINNHKPAASVNASLQTSLKIRFTTTRHTMFNSCYWNRYRSSLTDQYTWFLRNIKPLGDVCLIVEYTVLSFFRFLLWFPVLFCVENSLYMFSIVFLILLYIFFLLWSILLLIWLYSFLVRPSYLHCYGLVWFSLQWISLVWLPLHVQSLLLHLDKK